MPRLPRLNLPDIPQHIVQRGNNREACFYENKDYAFYLAKLKHYSKKYRVEVHSYVLMTNHVHLLVTPEKVAGVSHLMQSLGRCYVRYFNLSYARSGTLWEGRFRSSVIDSENYFLTVSRYIELNPVRAHMVKHPSEYPWSSFQKNAVGKDIKLITEHDCYLALGKTDGERQAAYSSLFEQQIPDLTLAEIRDAMYRSWVLGDDRFIKQIEHQTGRKPPDLVGGDRKSESFKKREKSATRSFPQ